MRRIEEASETILSRLQARRVPEDTDIVLGLTKSDDDEQAISYYFASMSKEAVFWYEPVEPGLVTEYERRVVSKKHLGELHCRCQLEWICNSITYLSPRCKGTVLVRGHKLLVVGRGADPEISFQATYGVVPQPPRPAEGLYKGA